MAQALAGSWLDDFFKNEVTPPLQVAGTGAVPDVATTTTGGELVSSVLMLGAAPDIRGLLSGTEGRRIHVIAYGGDAVLEEESGLAAAAANRINTGGRGNVTISHGSSAWLVYASSRWRLSGGAGADASTILNGTGAPSSGLGVNGDFYLDTAATKLYGPKASGTWPSGISLIGIGSYTTTTANFTQPASSSTVSVQVGTTAWMVAGEVVYVVGGGYYTVSSITDATHVVLTNLGYAGNASPSSTVTSGGGVSPSGVQGATGAAGSNGTNGTNGTNAYTTTSANFTQPAVSSTVSVQVGTTAWMAVGQTIFVATGGYYTVSSITDGTHVVLSNTGDTGNAAPSTTINSGSAVSPGGVQGVTGATGLAGSNGTNGTNGVNAYTTTSANFTQPAVSSTVSVQVGTTAWMAAGQYIFVAGGGYYTVSSITDGTHVVLSNLGYTGNASPSSTVTSGAAVSPGGIQGASGSSAITVAAFSSRPANSANIVFYPTDGVFQQAADGTNWWNIVGGVPLKEPPDPSGYTQTNFSTSSISKGNGVITFTALHTAGPNVRAAGKTINTLAGATVTACPITNSPAGNYCGAGVYMRETSSGKIYSFTALANQIATSPVAPTNTMTAERWTSATARTSFNDYNTLNHGFRNSAPILVRLRVSSPNILAEVSYNGGLTWLTYETVALTTVFTTQPNEFGVCAHVENNTTDAVHTFATLTFVGD